MTLDYNYIADMLAEVDIPKAGILSRTLYEDAQMKVILFGFDTGQELSEHTASMPAILHFLKGESRLVMGEDEMEAKAGTWAHMAANLSHSIYANTPVVLLLYLLKNKAIPEK